MRIFTYFIPVVAVNEDNQMRMASGLQSLCSRGVSHHHWHLAEVQSQAEEWESFGVEKREVFRWPDWRCLCGEALGRLIRGDILCGWLRIHFGFLCWS